MMKAKEIREMTAEEINAKIADLKEELFNLKFQAALGNIEKPARMNEIKRTIARMKTILTEGSYSLEKKAKKAAAKKAPVKAVEAAESTEAEAATEAPAKKTTTRKPAAKKAESTEAAAEAPVKKTTTRKPAAKKTAEASKAE